jgi:hypothetical protein
MIVKFPVKKEEILEKEIPLPFFYKTSDTQPTFVKIVDAATAVVVLTNHHTPGSYLMSPESAMGFYKMDEQVSQDDFEQAYWSSSLAVKKAAVPEYILSEDEKADFQNSY